MADSARGGSEECVIYVGSGDCEAFSRTKQWLGIITCYRGLHGISNEEIRTKEIMQVGAKLRTGMVQIYKHYKETLLKAVKAGLLIDLTEELGFNAAATKSGRN